MERTRPRPSAPRNLSSAPVRSRGMSTPSASEIEFSAFVDSAGGSLARTATMLTGNRDTAQDLLQEALVRVYLNWHKIVPGAARAYTRRVMGNLATDWWRRGRWEAVGTVPERPGASATAAVDDDDEFLRHLAGLAPRERAVLVLRFHADLTEREIAEELRLPLGTVKSLASRALAKLRAKDTSSTSWSRP